MPFTLVEVASATDFLDVMECLWISYENPAQSFFRMFCPIRGDGPSARIDSLRESASRMWGEHESDPASYWRKVVDDNGTIVGACLWKIYPANPFEKPDDHSEIYWYPEGEAREYVSKCLEAMEAPRERMGARPQVFLNIIFTHPDYRRQGVADMMLTWGKRKADEMGVEMWLDATEYGVPVYKKHGFVVVNENKLQPTKETPGEAWKKIEQELQPITFWDMWRPIGGHYEEGKTVKPWE
ncbi:acyl-CoA N-acyltransferase [Ilyonectria robusta]|uniref:acyl-CoA N-acyltransferase n=1 Tax=Ilyonectria robusta TaxID=1079257 RepID=UPI001E8D3E51|nr:acyl-CoA N-acyltransferase [Ilyonectria robusta]KAH8684044.1 acyl-CoA N-acyltransferase [Ilyonectria robusta]